MSQYWCALPSLTVAKEDDELTMPLDEHQWRPITFEGTTLPPTMMALSVLGAIFGDAELTPGDDGDEFYFWLKSFGICCGRIRSAPAEICHEFASRAVTLLRDNRTLVVMEVEERLGEYGFAPQSTMDDWLGGLQMIAELAYSAPGSECRWFAPLHQYDHFKTAEDAVRFLKAMVPPPNS